MPLQLYQHLFLLKVKVHSTNKLSLLYLLTIGSCLALNLSYSGCCIISLSTTCSNNGCYCDKSCHTFRDCCNDVVDVGCYPVSPPTDSLGKLKSGATLVTVISNV